MVAMASPSQGIDPDRRDRRVGIAVDRHHPAVFVDAEASAWIMLVANPASSAVPSLVIRRISVLSGVGPIETQVIVSVSIESLWTKPLVSAMTRLLELKV